MGSKVVSVSPVVCELAIISDGSEPSVIVGGAELKVRGATASETLKGLCGRREGGICVGFEVGDDDLVEHPRATGRDETRE